MRILFVILAFVLGACCVQGPRGELGSPGTPGRDGNDGIRGLPGIDGTNGIGCSVSQLSPSNSIPNGGALVTCESGSVVILNGADGADGLNAPPTPYTVTEIVNPCGVQGPHEEVFLRLANGTLLAHYSDGAKQFLDVLAPGIYQTTDGYGCHLTVHSDGRVTW